MASRLAARGISLRIVDKEPERSNKSRALVMHARTLELMEKMGVAKDLVDVGERSVHMAAYLNKEPVLDLRFNDIGAEDTPYPFLLFVSQVETERILDAHLLRQGVKIERPVEVLHVEDGADHATATLQHPDGRTEVVQARYIIGCDGAHSVVRKHAGLTFEGEAYAQEFWLADAEVDWVFPRDQLSVCLGDTGAFMVFPLKGQKTSRLMLSLQSHGETHDPTLEEFQREASLRSPVPLKILAANWLSRFRLHHRGVNKYRAGRLFVAGDAAHIHSPAGGQGMNTGIQDAYNLAWKLAMVLRQEARKELLDSYNEERFPVGQTLLSFTDQAFSVGMSVKGPMATVRNVMLPRVAPWLLHAKSRRARLFRFLSQLAIKYRESSVVGEDQEGAGYAFVHLLGPGHRAPDAPYWDGARASSIFSLLQDEHHHLIVFSSEEEDGSAGPREVLPSWIERRTIRKTEQNTVAFERYGIHRNGYYLIRPDGYIAFRGANLDLMPLLHFLEHSYGAGPG